MAVRRWHLQYIGTAQFWFESIQNWQSEFLAVAAIVRPRSTCDSEGLRIQTGR